MKDLKTVLRESILESTTNEVSILIPETRDELVEMIKKK